MPPDVEHPLGLNERVLAAMSACLPCAGKLGNEEARLSAVSAYLLSTALLLTLAVCLG